MKTHLKLFLFFFFNLYSLQTMAQSEIIISHKNNIVVASDNAKPAAILLKSYLDKGFKNSFEIISKIKKGDDSSEIILEISDSDSTNPNGFSIRTDTKSIYLLAPNEKYLRYAVYTLLEKWEFRKFTSTETYIPNLKKATFLKNTNKVYSPSFEYRTLFFPDCYDEDFRDWHKLDWQIDDFGIWGHTFNQLVPPKEYFKTNPQLFALYEGERNGESLCMTNDTVVDLVIKKMTKIIAETPNAKFYSVSQNDDIVYCECKQCSALNQKHGGPQGSLYFFLNKLASQFPNTKITTLAYLHTFQPPVNLKIKPNIYTIFCPIELNRGKAITQENSPSFIKTLKNWSTTASHLYFWDYTVQFSNYMSPFPNFQSFSENYKLLEKNNVKGVFVQGYADIPGDLSELRQYILAKLLWDTKTDIEKTTDDFLRGLYGKAAPAVKKYLNLLTENQNKFNQYLDIYSGPVQARNTFLNPEAMSQYDKLINEASEAVKEDPVLKLRIQKLRMALEYVYFEQSKFYGKNQHGMFIENNKSEKQIKDGLTERVLKFTKDCNNFGIYELSEGGLSPDNYYKEWLEIAQNGVKHLGEDLNVNFVSKPAEDFTGKGSYGVVDGNRGYKDFNINWIGWYANNPEIEIETKNLNFDILKINFLEDQRHWIFLPQKIKIYGLKDQKWVLLKEKLGESLTESYEVKIKTWELVSERFSKFMKIKIHIENQKELPEWRKRKNRKPMVMLDEIELYRTKFQRDEQ